MITIDVKKGMTEVKGSDNRETINLTTPVGNGIVINAAGANDIIKVTKGDNHKIDAGAGNDIVEVSGGNNYEINLGEGDDTLRMYGATGHKVTAVSGTNNITINSGSGYDITGGTGVDKLVVKGNNSNNKADLGAGEDFIGLATGTGNVLHAGADDDQIIISGTGGENNAIYGDAGDDKFKIYAGTNNAYDAGEGNDSILITTSSKNTVYGGNGQNQVMIMGGTDNVYYGGEDKDNITIKNQAQAVTVNAGTGATVVNIQAGDNHVINLGDGDSVTQILAGEGVQINGGAGKDTFKAWGTVKDLKADFGEGNDKIIVEGGTGLEINGGAGNDQFGIGNGSTENEGNTFEGGEGDDVFNISGGAQNTFVGGAGKDKYVVDWSKAGEGNVIDQTTAGADDEDSLQIKNADSSDFTFALEDGVLTMTDKESGASLEVKGFGNGLDGVSFDNKTLAGYDFSKEVVIDDGEEHGAIALGAAYPDDPNNFKITLQDGTTGSLTAFKDAREGEGLDSLVAKGNAVIVEKDGKVVSGGEDEDTGDVTGVELKVGHAENNSVTVNGGSVDGDLVGATLEEGTAIGNTATLKGGKADGVTGAFAEQGMVSQNSAVLNGGEADMVVGGAVFVGDATQNTVNVSNAAVQSVIGGMSAVPEDDEETELKAKGNASNNAVTVANSSVKLNVVGGGADDGNANNNTVTTNSVGVGGDEEDSGLIIGGKAGAKGNAEGNTVSMSAGQAVSVIGGQTKAGDATGNSVEIIKGAYVTGDVIGGKTESGNAADNQVTIGENAIVDGKVMANASENGTTGAGSVTVSGTVRGEILGDAGVDTVTIEKGFVKTIDLGAGDDVIAVNGGQVTEVIDGEGDDTISVNSATVYNVKLGAGENTVNIDGEGAMVQTIIASDGKNHVNMGAGTTTLYGPTGKDEPKMAFEEVTFSGKGGEVALNNVEVKSIVGSEAAVDENVDKLNLENSVITMTGGKLKGIAVNGGYNDITMAGGETVIAVNKDSMTKVKVQEGANIDWIGGEATQKTMIEQAGGNIWSGNLSRADDTMVVEGGFFNMDFGAGEDFLDMRAGAATNVAMGDGNDELQIHGGVIENADTGAGNDKVIVNKWGEDPDLDCRIKNLTLGTGVNDVKVEWCEVENIIAGDGQDNVTLVGGKIGISEGLVDNVKMLNGFNTLRVSDTGAAKLYVDRELENEKNYNAVEMNGGTITFEEGYLGNIKVKGGDENKIIMNPATFAEVKELIVEAGNADIVLNSTTNNSKVGSVKVKNEDSVVTADLTGAKLTATEGTVSAVTLHGGNNNIDVIGGNVEGVVGEKESNANKDSVLMEGGSLTLESGFLHKVEMFSWDASDRENNLTVKGKVDNVVVNYGHPDEGHNLAHVSVEGGTISYGDFKDADDTLSFDAAGSKENLSSGTFLMGAGNDTVNVKEYGFIWEIDLGDGDDTFTGNITGEPWYAQVYNLKTGAGNDTITNNGVVLNNVFLGEGENEVNLISAGDDKNVVDIFGSTGTNTINITKANATLRTAEGEDKATFEAVTFAGKGATVVLNNVDVKAVTGAKEIDQPEEGSEEKIEDVLQVTNSNFTLTGGKLTGIVVKEGYNEITMAGGDTVIAVDAGMANVTVQEGANLGWIGATTKDNTLLTVDGGNVWSGTLGEGEDLLTVNSGFANMDFGAGNDRVIFQGGAAENLVMGDGDDTAEIYIGKIQNLSMGAGNDVVSLIKGKGEFKVENINLGSGNNTVNVVWADAENIIGGDGNDTINMNGGTIGIGEGSIETINIGALSDTIKINGGTVAAINTSSAETDEDKANNWNKIEMNGGSVGVANGFIKIIDVNGGESNTITLGTEDTEEQVVVNELRVNAADTEVNLETTAAKVDITKGNVTSMTMKGNQNALGIKGGATVEALTVEESSLSNRIDLAAGNVTVESGTVGNINMYSWGEDVFENAITLKADASVGRIECNWGNGDTDGKMVADVTIEGGKLNSAGFGGGADKLTIVGGKVSYVDMGNGDDELTIKGGSDGKEGSMDNFYMGNGNDKVTVDAYGYIASINLGAGDDTFEMTLTQEPWWNIVDTLSVGAGNDTVTINSGNVNYLALESGTNTINVNGGTITKVACFTEVTNTINLAGGTIEEMTAGQADTINMDGGAITIVGGYGKVNEVLSINVKSGEENAVTLTNAKAKQIIAEGDAAVQLTIENTKEGIYENVEQVALGGGDDTINIKGFSGEPLITGGFSTGAGNDTLVVESTNISTVNMGDGNNEFSILSGGVSNLVMGDGDNTINGGNGLYNVVAGNGNNTVNLLPNSYGGYTNSVKLGDGDNIITVSDGYAVMGIEAGNGNNTINVSRNESKETVVLLSLKTGSGNDTVNCNSIGSMQTIDVGAGDDTVVMHSPYFKNGGTITVNLGEGNDRMSLLSDGAYTVNGGAGSDAFIIDWSKEFEITINEVAQSGDTNTLELTNATKNLAIMRNDKSWYTLLSNGNKQYLTVNNMDAMSSVTAAGTTYSVADIEDAFVTLQKLQLSFADIDTYLASRLDEDETERMPLNMVAGAGK